MLRFEIKDTPLFGLKHITRKPLKDNRGSFERVFCLEELSAAGWTQPVQQINKTLTKKLGTIRGMHYQLSPHAECKFVSCLKGRVLDVLVDLRMDSETFLQSYSAELSAENNSSLLIPEGFAHGFQTLTEEVEMLYLHSAAYAPEFEGSINPLDPLIDIAWPLTISEISERDKSRKYLDKEFSGISL